jgi:hypothetical protein
MIPDQLLAEVFHQHLEIINLSLTRVENYIEENVGRQTRYVIVVVSLVIIRGVAL